MVEVDANLALLAPASRPTVTPPTSSPAPGY